ncbi:MAG: metallophosphoesterase, partial [Actinomycetota bacterium]|nr:metallophosphoesterase [Actinomycetota bacterium]
GQPSAPPAAPAPAGTVIAAAGDIACAPGVPVTATTCRQGDTSNLLAGRAAVLPLGDLQYERGELENFRASYAPTWGRFDAVSFPAVGNHEYETPGAAGYFGYFGARAGDPSKGYYSYDIGGWHLISLNSNCSVVPCGAGSEQERWLRADLAAHPTACTLAYWHAPLFNSGRAGRATAMRPIWAALQAGGADVVLSAHEHAYERFGRQNAAGAADPAGPRQFTVGTGGETLFPAPTAIAANSEVRNNNSFGVLEMTLRAGSFDWRFVPAPGSTFTDAGSEACR